MSDRIKIKSTSKKEDNKEEKKEDKKEEKKEPQKEMESKNTDDGPADTLEYAKRKRKTDIASMFEENLVEEPEEDRGISKVEYYEPTKVEQVEGKKIKIKSDKVEIKKTPHRYKITTQPGPVQETKEEKSEFFKRYEKAVAEAQEEFEKKKKEGKLGFPL